jgi:hypothetical protein
MRTSTLPPTSAPACWSTATSAWPIPRLGRRRRLRRQPARQRPRAPPNRSVWTTSRLHVLRELGECLNYNGYGEQPRDLHFHPAELYRRLSAYARPLRFRRRKPGLRATSKRGMPPTWRRRAPGRCACGASVRRGVCPAGRRLGSPCLRGLCQRAGAKSSCARPCHPDALGQGALCRQRARADRQSPGADTLCLRFETGGGRKAAAGINQLAEARLDAFIDAFFEIYAL